MSIAIINHYFKALENLPIAERQKEIIYIEKKLKKIKNVIIDEKYLKTSFNDKLADSLTDAKINEIIHLSRN